jgi:phospholipid/cholesterol/gamma-HCH transport system substrate-binding protein
MARTFMDRDANYVAVGAFVMLAIALATGFVLWYTDAQGKHDYQPYEIYFEGTVAGLTQGSPVRYLGVDVGSVKRIRLDPRQRKTVQVIVDVDTSAPIDGSTLASLSLQGITGLLYVDLESEKSGAAVLPLALGQQYPVIRSAPSDFDRLLSSLPTLATHAVELVDHMNQVFSDDNLRSVKNTLDNLRVASEHLPATVDEARNLLADARRASQEIQGAAAGLRSIAAGSAPDLKASLARLREITENLAATTGRLDRFVADNQAGLSQFTRQGLPELEHLLRESEAAARDVRDLSRSLKENPSQLIYQPAYRGVEVPK